MFVVASKRSNVFRGETCQNGINSGVLYPVLRQLPNKTVLTILIAYIDSWINF